ncbi:glycosyltransferase family 4 protein [Ramlibacter sp. Leaf400]|uniref:glycosyltransferase family 4 protein n=1 Tax=Ramlibacter sp. Leaf400 TaxID=1736365 RepID=UPI0006F91AE0|nr:glycosyltransferase family 4 protein [Ramlibacter sp. Leaf400]KQT10383.1 glycosyl transferase [Ramlibacter sp. Leaf400]
MRIAQVAPLYESVPPRAYGGTERVVHYLTEALIDLGHDVTLFASGDSRTRARLVPVVDRSLRLHPAKPDPVIWHTLEVDRVFELSRTFDVMHFHIDSLHLPMAVRCETPSLTTLHGRLDLPDLQPLFRHFHQHPLVSISTAQRDPLPRAHWSATVHHGLPLGLYHFHPQAQDYFAFVGRISPEKRCDRAIEIALACNTPLHIAAKVDDTDRAYWEQAIEPMLDHPLITFVGEIDDAEKNDFIGNARALLTPIDWPEPFGLVIIEALACGTPVIAYGHGSVPELLDHGVTGFIVRDQEQAIAAARRVDEIDRRACREQFERRFAAPVMAASYAALYRGLIHQRQAA